MLLFVTRFCGAETLLEHASSRQCISIGGADRNYVNIHMDDVPKLIEALLKHKAGLDE